VSYGSGPHLPFEVGSDTAMYPTAPGGPQASSIKKRLAVLSVRKFLRCLTPESSWPARRAGRLLQCTVGPANHS
jgi:hypothetical protein